MTLTDYQELQERWYSREYVKTQIVEYLDADLNEGDDLESLVEALQYQIHQDHPYESKQYRYDALKGIKFIDILKEILFVICPMTEPNTIQAVASVVSTKLDWQYKLKSRKDEVQTVAEIICFLVEYTHLYNIELRNDVNGIIVESNYPMTPELKKLLENTMYLPPMVVKPKHRYKNSDSPFLTVKASAISDPLAQHTMPINLVALNIAGETGFVLDIVSFQEENVLSEYDPEKHGKMSYDDIQKRWMNHQQKIVDTRRVAADLYDLNTPFYFPHFYDSRGRMYPCGYNLTTNGNEYEKANLLLAKQEIPTGDFT